MSQKGLASATGIQQSEISRIERGVANPTRETLDRLGRALGARLGFDSPQIDPVATRTAGDSPNPKSASPYATGGGGVHFEHLTAAYFLGALLLDRTPPPIWVNSHLTELRFQQRAEGAELDDLVLVARGPGAEERLVEVAVRHRPTFSASDAKFVALLRGCLRSVETHGADYEQDARRLCIVVGERTPRTAAVRRLTDTARLHSNAASFMAAIRDKTNVDVVAVQDRLHKAVDVAQRTIDAATPDTSDEHFWRLLRALYLVPLDLEGESARERVAFVNDVAPFVGDADRSIATNLLARLVNVAAEWSANGATVDEQVLRRTLSSEFELARSRRHASAWALIERLSGRTESAIRSDLPGGFHLPRTAVHEAFVRALDQPSPLLVTGEPGTGKSAACRGAARAGRGEVLFLALRDLPERMSEFEAQLGCGLKDVLAGVRRGGRPLVILDGAEAALENRVALLRDLLTSIPAGVDEWQVCLVSRLEGSRKLQELASQVWPCMELTHVEIPGLVDAELASVAHAFPQLRHLLGQPRARWLMRRPFLVDLVLKRGMEAFLKRDSICEADFMDAVWQETVRLGGLMDTPRGSPDGREQAMLALGRAHLRAEPPGEVQVQEPGALTGLRADGLLRSGQGPSVHHGPPDFTHDVIRDFAVAHVLLWSADLVTPLQEAGAPRWSLRACRLACQARLGNAAEAELDSRLCNVETAFHTVAKQRGERWAEVPWEALVTLADPARALRVLWPRLLANSALGITRILEVLRRRFTSKGSTVELTVWEPVLEFLLASYRDLPDLILSDLDAAVVSVLETAALSALRVQVNPPATQLASVVSDEPLREQFVDLARHYLLSRPRTRHNSLVLRGLGLLGPAIDDAVARALREAASHHPDELRGVVDDFLVARRVVDARPDLLLSLADAYYIDRRPRNPEWAYSPLDDAVRDHDVGLGFPFANWYFGPFFMLLRALPIDTVAFLNALLDHAARIRVSRLASLMAPEVAAPEQGVRLRLFDLEERLYIGDSHVYHWYRGTAVGPYPCVSALLALEVYIDRLIDRATPLSDIGRWLLKDAHNLATLGLWVGVLVRHIDKVGDELDALLAMPVIWDLEAVRVTADMGGFRAQQPVDCHGEDRRGWTLTHVAAYFSLNAHAARAEQLRSIREGLLAAPGVDTARLRNWASQLDPSTYSARPAEQGVLVTQHPPDDVAAELQRRLEPGRQFMDVHRLAFTYGRITADAPSPQPNELRQDVALARELAEGPVTAASRLVLDAVAATASAALRCHFDGTIPLTQSDLSWCTSVVMELAEDAPNRRSDLGVIPEEKWEMGWDRSVARIVPVLLRERPDLEGLDVALVSVARSPYHETQVALVQSLETVWASPCRLQTPGARRNRAAARCLHERAYGGVVEMVSGLGLAPWDNELQRRPRRRLTDPILLSIRDCPGDMVSLGDMAGAASALDACASSRACIASQASELLDALLDLHARAWVSWASGDHFVDTRHAHPVNTIAARRVLTGDDHLLDRFVAAYAGHTVLLAAWLDALAAAAVTDEKQQRLSTIWPGLMDRLTPTLNAPSSPRQYHGDEALVEALLPVPPYGVQVETWPDAETLVSQVNRLLESRGSKTAMINQLIRFFGRQPRELQVAFGLDWFLTLVIGHEPHLGGRTRVADWLRRLRDENADELAPSALAKWQRLVDALAAAGDEPSIRLQQEEE